MLETVIIWAIIGSLAQLVDGALGMAYGVSTTTALVSVGVYPALASASVHTAEMFTTLVSGSAHLKLGNVERNTALHLVIPGIVGGITGVYVCTHVSGELLIGIVGFILLTMGLILVHRFAFKKTLHFRRRLSSKKLVLLGYVAAFLDALGGGGWGPVATTILVTKGVEPRKAIGTVNLSEFFVTTAVSITFLILLGPESYDWLIVLGLLVGGLTSAPIAAWLCKELPPRITGTLVGITIMILSIRMILKFAGLL